MADENQEWNVEQAKFQGYMKASMEENVRAHNALFDKVDEHSTMIADNKAAIAKLVGKCGLAGVGGGGILAFICEIAKNVLSKG